MPLLDLSAVPLFDHHCHALRCPGTPLDPAGFRLHFSESADPAMAAHLRTSLFYARGLRDLAALLDCPPEEDALLALRRAVPLVEYARLLVEAAKIDVMLVDTGYLSAESYRLEEQRAFLPCAVHEVMRLEAVMERCILETTSFAGAEERFRASLDGARGRGVLAFKSIAAYRGGLSVERRSRAEAEAGYGEVRAAVEREGSLRLCERRLLEYLLRIGLEAAAAQELPVQFHTGFGDDDADLRAANPLHLRPLLQDPALRGAPLVLLHCWPYAREAGYLAGIHGHVYVDLSLALPMAAHGGEAAILAALEQAPWSKLLLATDASRIPELFYLGARYAREALARALGRLEEGGWLTRAEAEEAARGVLHDNAARLYLGEER